MSGLLTALFQAASVGALALMPAMAWRLCLPTWVANRNELSSLLGICSVAWWLQFAYMFDIPVYGALTALWPVLFIVLWQRRVDLNIATSELLRQVVPLYAIFYTVCLLATSMVVWPAAGPWSTDWSATYLQIEVVAQGKPLKEWLLARPPMFACLAVPFLPWMPPLIAFQLSICAASAAALLNVYRFVQTIGRQPLALSTFLILFCASPFFLVNLTAFVPKFLQATLIVAALFMLRGAADDHLPKRMALSSLLLGLAIEFHHSTIAYLFVFALAWSWIGWRQPLLLMRGIAAATAVGLLIVAVPELRKIALYGIEEIAHFNPSKAMRSSEPLWFVVLMTLECKFAGYQFLVPPYIYWKDWSLGTLKPLPHYIHWFWFIGLGILSNTLLFILLPFVTSWSRMRQYSQTLLQRVPRLLWIGGAVAILVNCLLNPYYIASGNVHCGSTAIALGLMIVAMVWLAEQPRFISLSLWLTITLGCVPWLAWQALQFQQVVARGGFRVSGPVFDDELDQAALLQIDQVPWGHTQWPWLPLALGFGLLAALWSYARCTQTPSIKSLHPSLV